MDEATGNVLAFGIIAVSAASYWSVKAWSDARRLEREAFYRSEAIKKIAEMEGTISPAVLEALKSALQAPPSSFAPVADVFKSAHAHQGAAITEASVRVEALRRIGESGDNEAYMRFLKEWGADADARRVQAFRLGGAIMIAAGLGLMVFLRALVPQVFLVGLIPILVGSVLLWASFWGKQSSR